MTDDSKVFWQLFKSVHPILPCSWQGLGLLINDCWWFYQGILLTMTPMWLSLLLCKDISYSLMIPMCFHRDPSWNVFANQCLIIWLLVILMTNNATKPFTLGLWDVTQRIHVELNLYIKETCCNSSILHKILALSIAKLETYFNH